MKVVPNGRLTVHTAMFDLTGTPPPTVRPGGESGSRTRPYRVIVDWVYSWTSDCWTVQNVTVMERTGTGTVTSKITYASTRNTPDWVTDLVAANEPVTGTAWMKNGGCPDDQG